MAGAVCVALLAAQGAGDQQLEAAIHREMVLGDLKGAIAEYRTILGKSDVSRPVAARALLHMGECQEKLGLRRQAHDTFARVAREYDSETAVAAKARELIANWTEVLPGPRNLNFEEGEPGKMPPGWFVPSVEKTQVAELRRKGCRSGIGCAVVGAPATSLGLVPQLMQSFSAEAYRGKTVRLRAWLRVEGVVFGDRAQMVLREFRPADKIGFSADLDDRAVRSSEWTSVEITGHISKDAQFLQFGFYPTGLGRVWIDSVTFEVVSATSE